MTRECWEARARAVEEARRLGRSLEEPPVDSEAALKRRASELRRAGCEKLLNRAARAVRAQDLTPLEALCATLIVLKDPSRMRAVERSRR